MRQPPFGARRGLGLRLRRNHEKSHSIAGPICFSAGFCAGRPADVEPRFAAGHFVQLIRQPDSIQITAASDSAAAVAQRDGGWTALGVVVTPTIQRDGLHLIVSSPESPVKRIQLHWKGSLDPDGKYLGDAWDSLAQVRRHLDEFTASLREVKANAGPF
jgi:hypothetical protein